MRFGEHIVQVRARPRAPQPRIPASFDRMRSCCARPLQRVIRTRSSRRGRFLLGVLAFAFFFFPARAQDKVTYQEHILPLIEANCAKCHNSDKKKADLDLTSYQSALKGSGSGAVVLPGNPDGSKLWKSLTHAEEPFMPPNRPKLADKELEVFKKWITGGLLENATGKPIAAAPSGLDLTLKPEAVGQPDGPLPMPLELPIEPVIHTSRGTAITGLAASPWAPVVAVAGQKQVLLYHTGSLELLGILPFTEGQPLDLKFSRSGKLLLAAGGQAAKSGRAVLWDVVTGEHLMTLGDDYDTVLTADLRPDQSQVALGGPNRLVKLFSLKTGELQHKFKKHTDWVTAVAFSPSGQMLASADRNGGITVWDADNAQELFTLAGHKSAVTALSWRPDSKLLASSSEDGTVKLWEMQEGKQARSWAANSPGCLCVSYAPDGRLLTCGRDNSVTIWDASGGKPEHCQFFGNTATRAVFSCDAKQVIATDFDGRVGVWTSADQKRVGELSPNPVPLAEQIAAAKKRMGEVQARVTAATANIAAAQSNLEKATAASASAKAAFETATTEAKAKEAEVEELRQSGTNTPPDLPARLTAATNACAEAALKVTNASAVVEARAKEVENARTAIANAKAQDPDAELAEAKTALMRIESAQFLSLAYHTRETITTLKRQHDRVAATLEANRQSQQKAGEDLAAAKQAAAKAEAELRFALTAVATNEPAATRLATELKAEQARLESLLTQYRSAITGGASWAKKPTN
jgi:hypothetical protein